MSDSEEVIPEKKGRGRPPAEKVEKVINFSNQKAQNLLRICSFINRSAKPNLRKLKLHRPKRVVEGQKARPRRAPPRRASLSRKTHASRRRNQALKKKSLENLRVEPPEAIRGGKLNIVNISETFWRWYLKNREKHFENKIAFLKKGF